MNRSDRGAPLVTALCVTRNGRDAVRLMLASFAACTPEPCPLWIADNGSTDGTFELLSSLPWVHTVRTRRPITSGGPALHGVALDYLAARVTTPYFITVDSDVEFLAPGWLSDLLGAAEATGSAAVGPYAAGVAPCLARLEPYLLLVRTEAFRSLGSTFQGYVAIGDPSESRRWLSRPKGAVLTRDELTTYTSAEFADTGAIFFRDLREAGHQWRDLPHQVSARVHHLGHMSWPHDAGDPGGAGEAERKLAYVQTRICRRYGDHVEGERVDQ